MRLHSVIVSWNRPELTRRTIESYLDTVTHFEHSLLVVDNGSSAEQVNATGRRCAVMPLGQNHGVGYAANRGWEAAPWRADLLQRLDNDVELQPGWCEDVFMRASEPTTRPLLYGMTAPGDEAYTSAPGWPVGGNAIISQSLFDRGLRYMERPWPDTEEREFTQDALDLGAQLVWGKPGLLYLWDGDEEYRRASHAARNLPYAAAPSGPGWKNV